MYTHSGGLEVGIEKRTAISNEIMRVLQPRVDSHLLDYRLLQASFIPKKPEPESDSPGLVRDAIPAHLDPTIVDEDRYRSLVIWFALTDVDSDNGTLWVLRGSHRMTSRLRAFPSQHLKGPADTFSDEMINEEKRLIAMKAGSMIMFHPGLLHWSGPNLSPHVRVALQLWAAPREAEIYLCRVRDDGKIERYQAPDDFILSYARPEFDEIGELVDVKDPV
jgi:hypothetical protein